MSRSKAKNKRNPSSFPLLRAGAVQYELSGLASLQDFLDGLQDIITEASADHVDLLIFPEYLTAHLLCLEPEMNHEDACAYLDRYTEEYISFFKSMASQTGIAILAGTHICRADDTNQTPLYLNQAYFFFPDGRMETQTKLHLTPEEQTRWPMLAGQALNVFDSPWGKLAILTCYDIEFPELARIAAEKGASVLLCPSYTDREAGFYRVRHCAQARAVENQLFVIMSGLVGQLPVELSQLDRGYSRAGIFAPCDHPFPPDGVLAEGPLNVPSLIIAELEMKSLHQNRMEGGGAVAPFFDRRPALYDRERAQMYVKPADYILIPD